MANKSNVTMEDIQRAMNDPSIKNCKPSEIISRLTSMFGMEDVDPVSQEEADKVRDTYFQACRLEKDKWTPMNGAYVQIVPFKLKQMPRGNMVADVLIDKTDFEAECFDKFIRKMDIRGQSIIFYASTPLPVDIVIGLKCVDSQTGEPIRIPDEMYHKASE